MSTTTEPVPSSPSFFFSAKDAPSSDNSPVLNSFGFDPLTHGGVIKDQYSNFDVSKVEMTREAFEDSLRGNVTYFRRNNQQRQEILAITRERDSLQTKLEDAKKEMTEDQTTKRKLADANIFLRSENSSLKRRITTATDLYEHCMETRKNERKRLLKVLRSRNKRLKKFQEVDLANSIITSISSPGPAISTSDGQLLAYYQTMLANPDVLRAPRIAQFNTEVLADPLVSAFVQDYGGTEFILKYCQQYLVNPKARQEVPQIKKTDKFTKTYLSTEPAPSESVNNKLMSRLRKLAREEQERQMDLGWIDVEKEDRIERVLSREEMEDLEKKKIEKELQLMQEQLDKDGEDGHQEPTEDSERTFLSFQGNGFVVIESEKRIVELKKTSSEVNTSQLKIGSSETKRSAEPKKTSNAKRPRSKKQKVSRAPSFEDCEVAEGMLMKKLNRG